MGHLITGIRGMGAPEAGLCCERAESLARSPSFYRVLLGQWRQSLSTGKLSATLQIAKRLYALAQDAQPQSEDSSLTFSAIWQSSPEIGSQRNWLHRPGRNPQKSEVILVADKGNGRVLWRCPFRRTIYRRQSLNG